MNEEFGWRSYALDKMLIRYGFVKGSLMLGFVWGLWHLPWIFFSGQWQAQAFQVSPWWFVVYVVQCMIFSVVISVPTYCRRAAISLPRLCTASAMWL